MVLRFVHSIPRVHVGKLSKAPDDTSGLAAVSIAIAHRLGNGYILTEMTTNAPIEIRPLKPAADEAQLAHKRLLSGPFWQRIPAYAQISEGEFLDHKWQSKHTLTNAEKLLRAIGELVPKDFIDDAQSGFHKAPMGVRVSPYLLSLIDWTRPYEDPLRRQFIPVASRLLPDHPKLGLDSLGERADAPVPGLTHRYIDKALFLPLDTCPVYCRFCTRSYAVGVDTDEVEKDSLHVNEDRWNAAFKYIASRPELEDIVVSGGDAYNLRPAQL